MSELFWESKLLLCLATHFWIKNSMEYQEFFHLCDEGIRINIVVSIILLRV